MTRCPFCRSAAVRPHAGGGQAICLDCACISIDGREPTREEFEQAMRDLALRRLRVALMLRNFGRGGSVDALDDW